MPFEWDEDKRQSSLAKLEVDFIRARLLFDGRAVVIDRSAYPCEERYLTIGIIDDLFYTVVWTPRDGKRRLISARRARDDEKRAYRAVHGGGT
jgi:hypothetical protein